MHRRCVSRFSVEALPSHRTDTFRIGTLLCFGKFMVSKKIKVNRGKVYHDSPSLFLSHSTETFRRGTLLCFRKYLVPKKFMDKRGRGPITTFRPNFFCLTVQKHLRFSVSKFFWSLKVLDNKRRVRGGGVEITRFSFEIVLSHRTETF